MKRLAATLAVAALLPVPAAPATYAGQVRTATATFRLRGLDGHLYTLGFTTRGSGLAGTSTFQQAELALTDCAGARCTTAHWVTPLRGDQYGESLDLSVTLLSVRIGTLQLYVGWSSAAGFGAMPPTPATADGVTLTSGRAATAVLLAGTAIGEQGFLPVARCTTNAGRVASAVGAFTSDVPTGDWPDTPPRGLRVGLKSTRFYRCA